MADHVKFGVSDHASSKAFFLEASEPLGIAAARTVCELPRRV